MATPLVFRCELCGARLTVWNGYLELYDRETGSYPASPDRLESMLVCCDCDTAAYHIPLRELVTPADLNGWIVHLTHKVWYPLGGTFDLIEAHGIAQQLKAADDPDPAPRKPPIPQAVRAARVSTNPRSITLGLRARIMERDGFRCRRCGVGPTDERLVVDHIIPVASGGTGAEDNLQTLCQPCNAGKSARPPHLHDFESGA